ncbi:LPS export ABC transporter permease LptF [Arenimonas maotaiensis]|uniref:Lipopolysaccharide export system permease protein LptF n=1 Tax=Arenimonas maotaiensis TaxID=1446479 RepID=A0A917CIT2_9GAMM|nr:LPS export ABC transporter permease LptF [Arenimonas maotaiensis]GGF89732.1 LPS export ABC transporter permease LptF [Arenimonas maotaiensis]
MSLIDRYLFRQFSQLVAAVLLVLFLISVGGFLTDLIAEISRGKVPATLMLQLLVLRMPRFLSFVMPLALFIGLMMAIARLYADSEMAVLASVGVGSRSLWRPVALVAAPLVLMIAFASLWLVPWTAQKAKNMVEEANRSFLVSGLEPGRFVDLPGNSGILFVTELSRDGREFGNLFVQRENGGRLDIITAGKGELRLAGGARVLRLENGTRIEGELGRRDFRKVQFAVNEIRVPEPGVSKPSNKLDAAGTLSLIRRGDAAAMAELHWRIALPLFAGILALLAIPLARSEPRQPQYGLVLFAVMAYLLGMLSLLAGTYLIGEGRIPAFFGLWWVILPFAALAAWLFRRDGRLKPVPETAA